MYKFAPAWEQETLVFGASQPGYTDNQVYDWIEFMKSQNMRQVHEGQYPNLFDYLIGHRTV